MILTTSILLLASNVLLLIRVRGLTRERDHLRCVGRAWQEYACAVEVAHECHMDLDDPALEARVGRKNLYKQWTNAAGSAKSALRRLRALGEYPDAYGCSPFLPPEKDDENDDE